MHHPAFRITTEHHEIGTHRPPYMIAEVGLNHNGDLDLAVEMARSAAHAGASGVKFQLYDSRFFIHPSASLGEEEPGSLQRFFRRFELSHREWEKLAREVRALGVDFFCSVFDAPSLQFYRSLEPRLIKVASADVDNRLLLEDAGRMGVPVLLSTGTAREEEVERARAWIGEDVPLLLFQCVSAYPASPDDFHLRLLPRWRERFGPLVGLSDHSEGNVISLGAVALGAVAVERHFTLDRNLEGPDQKLSLTPSDFESLVHDSRLVYRSLGSEEKLPGEAEEGVRKHGRRSLALLHPLKEGQPVLRENLVALRPGGLGLAASRVEEVVGRRLTRSLAAYEFLQEGDLG